MSKLAVGFTLAVVSYAVWSEVVPALKRLRELDAKYGRGVRV